MYNGALAQTVALLIVAQEQQPGPHLGDREAAAYHVIDRAHLLTHLSDDRKADLYSFLVEHPMFNKFTTDLALAVDYALEKVHA